MDEGYIKFRPIWEESPAFTIPEIVVLIRWRQACYRKRWIGRYDNGIGYGNISCRAAEKSAFYITGSATGGISEINATAISKVTRVDAAKNTLWCNGPIIASSESMSHAAIYEELDWVQGVIHIHHQQLWKNTLHHLPTTAADAPYGSPEMVDSIITLLRTTDLPKQRVFVMEGHEEGIFAFGEDLAAAFEVLESAFTDFL